MIRKQSTKEKIDRALEALDPANKNLGTNMTKSLQRTGISNFMNRTLSTKYNSINRGSQNNFLNSNQVVKNFGRGLIANQSQLRHASQGIEQMSDPTDLDKAKMFTKMESQKLSS